MGISNVASLKNYREGGPAGGGIRPTMTSAELNELVARPAKRSF